MKKILSLTSALLITGAAGMVLAQTSTTTPAAPSAQTTPMMKHMGNGNHPLIREIWARVKMQNERIMAGVKNGKLTKDEAMALHAKVKSIREEMQADVKSNGNGELTGDQYKQLNQEFDENSTAIHDEKTDGAAATPTAN